MKTIGFIGLGNMGLLMAVNLLKANFKVMGFDLNKQKLELFVKEGGLIAENILSLTTCDLIITMLQTGEQVLEVYKNIFANAKNKPFCVDSSTIEVTHSKELHALAKNHGISLVDAPVSGGIAGAKNKTLTFMVGASEDNFKIVLPVLNAMGKKIMHVGPGSTGHAVKICNNMILGMSMIAVSEAFVLAKSLGVEAKSFHEAICNSSGQCWVTNNYVPVPGILDNVPANNNYAPGFTAQMMLKDLNLAKLSFEKEHLDLKLASKAQEIYSQFTKTHNCQLDFSAIIQEYEDK